MNNVRRIEQSPIVRDTEGLSTVEYVIILALIAAFAVGAWQSFGEEVQTYLDGSATEINSAMPDFAKGK